MKKPVIVLFFIFVAFSSYAQDLILTFEGDSLNCKITKVRDNFIYFIFKYKDEIRNTLLSKTQVKNYQYGFYSQSIVPADKVKSIGQFPHFRLAVGGGWSYRTPKIGDDVPLDLKQYMKKLKSGFHLGGDVTYYFSKYIGLGIKYNIFNSSNEINNVDVIKPDGTTQHGKMSDNISISYIGACFSTRLLNSSKTNAFFSNLSLGYFSYKDRTVLIDNYSISGNTIGISWDLGYDIKFSKYLSLGFQISYLVGTITSYNINDGFTNTKVDLNTSNYESLERLDLSIGLRFIR